MGATEDGDGERTYSFEQWKAIGKEALAEGYTYPPVTDTRKMCEMLFTSGTTGTSKCVMLCQENIFSVVTAADETVDFSSEDRVLSVLPLHHTYELACTLALLNYGASCAINDSITKVVANLKKYRPTTLVVVPLYVSTFYKRIWNEAKNKKKDKVLRYGIKASNALLAFGIDIRKKLFDSVTSAFGGNLKKMVCGGAALNPALVHTFESFGISIYEGFGITECAPLTNVTPYYNRKPGSVGPAVPCCTVRIAENGDITEDGYAEGEIQVKGKNVMLGYYKNEEATREAFTEDGWFRTKDLCVFDKKTGYLVIKGRANNMIVGSTGENIYPEEIESVINSHHLVTESIVVADKGTLVALVALDKEKLEEALSEFKDNVSNKYDELMKEIREYVNSRVGKFARVSQVEEQKDGFEKTPTQKIKRFLYKRDK
ncbi:MAG: AMP-binding protein [Tidjanibacter sp.]|nr:AMP-binding protein [Tidjanibacter sp.]